ncbi:MAG: hypothetical protein KDJ97_02185 [Anaerolineae bacterium]|nr:hypothetical protein [Anaerolineae bacterium]
MFNPLEHLRKITDNFSDEIPNKVLHGRGNFKIRRNWWSGAITDIELALNRGEISTELVEETKEFVNHYTSEDFHNQPLTTREDIQRVTRLIDRILNRSTLDR